MAFSLDLTTVQEAEMLVAFFDLTQFSRYAKAHTDRETFEMLDSYFELVSDIVEDGGGIVTKFIGDAGLLAFGEESIESGVRALCRLLDEGDAWLAARGTPCRNIIKAHVGPVVSGPLGSRTSKRFDVCGETVNIAARLKSDGLAMTPQVFRKLSKDARTLFKKHTPPMTYIPVDQRHKD